MAKIYNLVHVAQGIIRGPMDKADLWHAFIEVVNGLPGVTVINSVTHDFPGGGFTGLILLGESHTAIHTWPELGVAWVELATCGDPMALTVFVSHLRAAGYEYGRII